MGNRSAPAKDREDIEFILRQARASRAYRELLLAKLEIWLWKSNRAPVFQFARRGFLVTTTADDVSRDREQNERRSLAARESSAQYVSTDALIPQRKGGYSIQFAGQPILCNERIDLRCAKLATDAATKTAAGAGE